MVVRNTHLERQGLNGSGEVTHLERQGLNGSEEDTHLERQGLNGSEEDTHLERQGLKSSEGGNHSPGKAGAGSLVHSPLLGLLPPALPLCHHTNTVNVSSCSWKLNRKGKGTVASSSATLIPQKHGQHFTILVQVKQERKMHRKKNTNRKQVTCTDPPPPPKKTL